MANTTVNAFQKDDQLYALIAKANEVLGDDVFGQAWARAFYTVNQGRGPLGIDDWPTRPQPEDVKAELRRLLQQHDQAKR